MSDQQVLYKARLADVGLKLTLLMSLGLVFWVGVFAVFSFAFHDFQLHTFMDIFNAIFSLALFSIGVGIIAVHIVRGLRLCRNPGVYRISIDDRGLYVHSDDPTSAPSFSVLAPDVCRLVRRKTSERKELNQAAYQWPALGRILPDVFAFAIGLGAAWMLEWKTTDLVWSLWLCSLVLGYLTILSTIGVGVYRGVKAISREECSKDDRLLAILIEPVAAVLLLGFFSLHFCGFHAGQAGFLSMYFPVEGLPKNAFFDAFMNPVLLWKIVFQHLLTGYGIFLIPAIIAERRYVFASITEVLKAAHEGIHKHEVQDFMQSGKGRTKALSDSMIRPYINVIRMQILIFVFGFCHTLKVESFFIYAVVYFVYFFPWKAFRKGSS